MVGTSPAGAEDTKATKAHSHQIDGNYRVTIKPDHHSSYSTIIKVTRIDEQNIKLSGTYDGFPLAARGVLRQQASAAEMDTYDFAVNNSFFSGRIVLSFQPADGGCRIIGAGSGDYNYLGFSGTASATISGENSRTRINTGMIGLIIGVMAVGLLFWLSWRWQPTGK